jgi:hypothetical protein
MSPDDQSSDSQIVRSGSDGRLRYTLDQRQALLEAFDRSGMSALSFTRLHGIQYQTFIAWVRKRREAVPKPHSSEPAFAEVLLEKPQPDTSAASPRIVLPCGTAIEISKLLPVQPCRSPPNSYQPCAARANTIRQPSRLPRPGHPPAGHAGQRGRQPHFIRSDLLSESFCGFRSAGIAFMPGGMTAGRLPGNQPWWIFIGDLRKY